MLAPRAALARLLDPIARAFDRVTLKLLHPSRHDARAEARFEREARLTGELDHPNLRSEP